MKNKLAIALILFLVLIPFRLPISILFIYFFEWIIGITTAEEIPGNVLATNVILSKAVYNIAISACFVYNIEMFSREKLNRKARTRNLHYEGGYQIEFAFWWSAAIGILLCAFVFIDMYTVHDIFFNTSK